MQEKTELSLKKENALQCWLGTSFMSLSGNCGDYEKGQEFCSQVSLKDQIAPAANKINAGLNARVGVPVCPV